jgi:hypothetical protein
MSKDPYRKPYQAEPQDPLREVLLAMTGQEPPAFVKGYSTVNLTDAQRDELQDWCSVMAKPFWLTGIGLIDAAEAQIQEAVNNGNIPPPPNDKEDLEPVTVRSSRPPKSV